MKRDGCHKENEIYNEGLICCAFLDRYMVVFCQADLSRGCVSERKRMNLL